jgi:hypothetical protein
VAAAHWAVTWGVTAYYSSLSGGAPFWIEPGLKPATIVYAIVLAITGAAILGVLPAIKATGINVQAQLRNLATGSTLRFGGVWTTAVAHQRRTAQAMGRGLAAGRANRNPARATSGGPGYTPDKRRLPTGPLASSQPPDRRPLRRYERFAVADLVSR